MKPGALVLLTDFGLQDPYVGVMKGVILGLSPRARIVDLAHGVPAQDVRSAAFSLMSAAPFFPQGSLFVTVVDPGVGTGRRILWARGRRWQFLFPDNGVTGWVERVEPFSEVREVSSKDLFLPVVSSTFHGRDIFAPVAAGLSRGLAPAKLGPRTRSWEALCFPEPEIGRTKTAGEVLVVDRFGNAVTNIPFEAAGKGGVVGFRGRRIGEVRSSYACVPPGTVLAVRGSWGFVELSVRDGDFAGRYKASPGDRVEVSRP
ncbi:MAG: SAM-dependent chlorinase/fluorinase [Elusimicrobia bacterium]|nr:SAM-dependent chlorinase/fluorinase [Elusimicrobiota bacterium]